MHSVWRPLCFVCFVFYGRKSFLYGRRLGVLQVATVVTIPGALRCFLYFESGVVVFPAALRALYARKHLPCRRLRRTGLVLVTL